MDKNKKNAVTVRFEKEEKEYLEKMASEQCMSISQYIRYIMLEQKEESEIIENELKSIEHIKKMTRNILFMRCFSDAFIRKFLTGSEANELAKNAKALFDNYGVADSLNKENGSNT